MNKRLLADLREAAEQWEPRTHLEMLMTEAAEEVEALRTMLADCRPLMMAGPTRDKLDAMLAEREKIR